MVQWADLKWHDFGKKDIGICCGIGSISDVFCKGMK